MSAAGSSSGDLAERTHAELGFTAHARTGAVHFESTRDTILDMGSSDYGRAPWRVIIIQVVLLLGLVIFFKLYLPHRARQTATREAATREQRINSLFQNAVELDTTQEVSVPLHGTIVKQHPQKLRLALSPQDVESTLGVPATSTTDFRGGQHLTWIGTAHKLKAAFNAGRIYCLTLEDLSTGHGEMVFAVPTSWHPY